MLKTRNDLKDIIKSSIILLTGIRSLDHSSQTPLETPGNINQENNALVWHQTHLAVPDVTDYIAHSWKVALFWSMIPPYLIVSGKSLGPRSHSCLLTSVKEQSCTDATYTKEQDPSVWGTEILDNATSFLISFHSLLVFEQQIKRYVCVCGGGRIIPFSTTILRYYSLEF